MLHVGGPLRPILALVLVGCSGDPTTSPTGTDSTDDTGTPGGTTIAGDPLVVDGVDYWPIVVTVQPDPNFFRLQVNYADADALDDTVTETGQSSTFAVTLTAVTGPAASTSYTWTDSRFPTDPTVMSGYASFFFGTGHPHAGANFLSPSSGTLDAVLGGGRWRSELQAADWTDEAGSGATIHVEGALDFPWSP